MSILKPIAVILCFVLTLTACSSKEDTPKETEDSALAGAVEIQLSDEKITVEKGENGVKRMQIMTSSTDGFVISQKDLEMRGPGELFGKRQSGLPEFKVADIVEDELALEAARYEAGLIIMKKDFFTNTEYDKLRYLVGIEDGQITDILD